MGSQESDFCKKWAEISEGDLVLVHKHRECRGHKHLGSLLFILPLCSENSAFQFGPFLSLPCKDIWHVSKIWKYFQRYAPKMKKACPPLPRSLPNARNVDGLRVSAAMLMGATLQSTE